MVYSPLFNPNYYYYYHSPYQLNYNYEIQVVSWGNPDSNDTKLYKYGKEVVNLINSHPKKNLLIILFWNTSSFLGKPCFQSHKLLSIWNREYLP